MGEIGSAKRLSEVLPENIDIVAVFEYGIFDPGDPQKPLNAPKIEMKDGKLLRLN
jgi:hypothetical protein